MIENKSSILVKINWLNYQNIEDLSIIKYVLKGTVNIISSKIMYNSQPFFIHPGLDRNTKSTVLNLTCHFTQILSRIFFILKATYQPRDT